MTYSAKYLLSHSYVSLARKILLNNTYNNTYLYLKFIHKDSTKFSCKFCKEDFVEQYLQLHIHSYIQIKKSFIIVWLRKVSFYVIQTAVYTAERFMSHWNFSGPKNPQFIIQSGN